MASSSEILTYIELSLRMRDISNALSAAILNKDGMSKDFKEHLDSMARRMTSVKDSLSKLEEIVS